MTNIHLVAAFYTPVIMNSSTSWMRLPAVWQTCAGTKFPVANKILHPDPLAILLRAEYEIIRYNITKLNS